MNTLNKYFSFLLIFLINANVVFAQKKVKDTYLNKKSYLVEVTMTGGKKKKIFSEEIGFTSGKIKSKHFMLGDNGGFIQGDYEVTNADTTGEARTFDFKASIKNSKDEYLIYEGTVYGDMIDGKIVWETSKHKVKSEMTFTGTVKEKGQKYVPAEKTVENPSGKKSSGKAEDSKSSDKKAKEDKNLDDEILNDDLD